MKIKSTILLFASALMLSAKSYKPCGSVPTENQLRWQEMEMYAFIHYSLNTYTDQEWGFGNEDPKLFNPSNLDCRQWARRALDDVSQGRGAQTDSKTLQRSGNHQYKFLGTRQPPCGIRKLSFTTIRNHHNKHNKTTKLCRTLIT